MSTDFTKQPPSNGSDYQSLIDELRDRGITYLTGGTCSNQKSQQIKSTNVEFIQRLAVCDDPRIRDASVALFLLHPELASDILKVLQTSSSAIMEQLVPLTLATLYLQRQWFYRLTLASGKLPAFPEQSFRTFWEKYHLPSPAYHDGDQGLHLLQKMLQKRSGLPLNYIDDWQNHMYHLLYQEGKKRLTPQKRVIQYLKEYLPDESEEVAMSMRPDVDKGRIEHFLKQLGRSFHKSGRLYLVGGAAMVHAGVRTGATEDIDIEVHADDEDSLLEAIRTLKNTLNLNVELASPADFIPLPDQWEMNARYTGRYGSLDVFYFDFYSIALSKIHHGTSRDIHDVKLLLQHQFITLQELDQAYHNILPRVGKRPYLKLDPEKFATQYTAIRQAL